MPEIQYSQLRALLKAIDNDWAVCDDRDEDDHMTLVNADRDVNKTLKPPKSLIPLLEEEGLIEFDHSRSDQKGKIREYMKFFDDKVPVPFVYFYKLTPKAREFLKS